jgi:hypothetical protein
MPRQQLSKENHYQTLRPPITHFVSVTCEEIDCERFLNGWVVVLPADHETHIKTIKDDLTRRYTETWEAGLVTFSFPPGTPCYMNMLTHKRARFDQLPLFVKKVGVDRKLVSGVQWHDDFQEDVYQIKKIKKEG